VLIKVVKSVMCYYVLMPGKGCLRLCKHAKSQRQISRMFHPIDKDKKNSMLQVILKF
jgi:hypothetical protein